jgi:hypothetical protein
MRRHRKLVVFTVLAITAVIATQQAWAADGDPQPTNPTGFGDLLPTPDLTNGDTRTLFENYGPMSYGLDYETGLRETFKAVFNGIANLLMMYVVAIVRGAISVGWWLFSFTDIKPVTDATSSAVGTISQTLVGWLLPSALALGAVVAYVQRRSQGSALGQMIWVLTAGVLSVSFAMSPATWLNGVDGARKLGAEAVMSASSSPVGGTMQTPMAWPEPAFSGTPRDTLLRKSADATWRAFAVTPWCIAEFGSVEACQRYGKNMLDKGTDGDERMKYIEGDISKAEGSGDADTVQWTKGKNPFGRIGVLTLAAIAATIFAFLSVALAFTALMAFVGCLLLLVVGVFFACLWIIPGRPRQWGLNWFEALIGLVIQSVMAMLIFGTALTLVTAVFGLTGTLGWLPVSGLAIVVLLAGFRLRRLLEGLTTMMRPGMASVVMGSMARRGALSLVSRLVGGLRSRAAAPEPRDRRWADTTRMAPDATPSRRPLYRELRAAGRRAPASIAAGRPARELPAGVSAGAEAGPAVGPSVNGQRTTTGDRFLSRPKQVPALTASGSMAAAVPIGSRAESDRVTKTTVAARSGRRSPRQGSSPAARALRYEVHDYGHTASLRDGPPKLARDHRRPRAKTASTAPRPYREYTRMTKEGTTIRVPVGR